MSNSFLVQMTEYTPQVLNRSYMVLSPNTPYLNHFVQQHNIATALSRLDELKSKLPLPTPIPSITENLPDLSGLTDEEEEHACGRDSTIPFDIGSPEHGQDENTMIDFCDKTPIKFGRCEQPLADTTLFHDTILEKTLGDFNLNHIVSDYPDLNSMQFFVRDTS